MTIEYPNSPLTKIYVKLNLCTFPTLILLFLLLLSPGITSAFESSQHNLTKQDKSTEHNEDLDQINVDEKDNSDESDKTIKKMTEDDTETYEIKNNKPDLKQSSQNTNEIDSKLTKEKDEFSSQQKDIDEDNHERDSEPQVMSNSFLQRGDNSPEVQLLKENLNLLGFHVGMKNPPSFGPDTERGVKEFQSYYGLEVSGKADEQTLNKIDMLLSNALKRGDNSSEVQRLKENLNHLGFSVGMSNPSSFGPDTERAVKEFQTYYGLIASGVAEDRTLNKIDVLLSDTLKRGDNSVEVKQLKENLNYLGFSVGMNNPSNFGPDTERAVKEFQSYYGLKVTGVADEQTLNRIQELLAGALKRGDKSPRVQQLKENLNLLGFNVGMNNPPNFGPDTERAVKEFQTFYDLEVTGIADKHTLNKIDELLSTALKRGDNSSAVQKLKEDLNTLTFTVGMNSPRNFGPATERAVKDFQAHYGLPVSGMADSYTLNKIQSLIDAPLSEGLRRVDVLDLKLKLNSVGFFVSDNPTYYYGSTTVKVVKEFQTYYGLSASGTADQTTLDKIEEVLSNSLKPGDNSSKVEQLKENLNTLGFSVGMNSPQNYGPATERSVKAFQKHYKLRETGVADPKTLSLIGSLLEDVLKRGDNSSAVQQLKENLNLLGFEVSMNSPKSYGPATEKAVKAFQAYYGLHANGTANDVTLKKLEILIENAYWEGQKSKQIEQLKENLNKLGFSVGMSYPESFGPATERAVKAFQEFYGLKVSGVAEESTLNKIQEILNSPLKRGANSAQVRKLKEDLNKLGFSVGMKNPNNFGPATESAVKAFQKAYNLPQSGIADEITLAKIEELKKGITYTQYNLTIEQAVEIQMNQKAQTDKKEYAWVSKNYIDSNNKVTANALNVRTQPTTKNEMGNKILGTLSKGTRVDIVGEKGNWYAIKYSNNNWVHAVEKDVRYYLDPDNFINDSRQRFQFLDLSRPSGAPKEVLNNYLKGKGELAGQGQAFIDAARLHGVNDIYLISHSILETRHGTSTLAKGVRVGLNKKDEPERVTTSNEKSLTEIKKVHNVYGIGAYDSCPIDCGAEKAYSEGWDEVSKAIVGGAEFIGNNYIKAGQNTLYKMRWNPLMSEGMAWKQYATDIGWASKQVDTMYNLYRDIGYDNPILDIPVYK